MFEGDAKVIIKALLAREVDQLESEHKHCRLLYININIYIYILFLLDNKSLRLLIHDLHFKRR